MSRSSSIVREQFVVPAQFRNLYHGQKPQIKICLRQPKTTYTTLTQLQGNVVITTAVDQPFKTVDIELVGQASTSIPQASSVRSRAFHQFLRLSQPGLETLWPGNSVFQAGVTYEFPFVFNIPQQLLPKVCEHAVRNEHVRDAHLQLPPTLGDRDLAAWQKTADDVAPDMARVRYGVCAQITATDGHRHDTQATLASKIRHVRVIPSAEVQPPLDVSAEEGDYCMRTERVIRKGILKSKIGTLIMQATQPRALQVQSYDDPHTRTDSYASIVLRYDPLEDDSHPPRLESLSSRLKVSTFYSTRAQHSIPSKESSLVDMAQGRYAESFDLSSRSMVNVEWTRHDQTFAEVDKVNSLSCARSTRMGGIPEPSKTYKGKGYYTVQLVVPLQLPTNKTFVPTFHSCLISRVYALRLDLSISTGKFGSSMSLRVPIQVSSEGLLEQNCTLWDSVGHADDTELDVEDWPGFFTNSLESRSVGTTPDDYTHCEYVSNRTSIGNAVACRISGNLDSANIRVDAPPGYMTRSGEQGRL